MLRRYKLDAGTPDDFLIWGLICQHEGHKVCWEINHRLDLGLSRKEDIEVVLGVGYDPAYFNLYVYEDELNYLRYEVIRNKCHGQFYLSDLKHIDYIVMVKGELGLFDESQFLSTLKNIPVILSVMEIDLGKIRHIENLVLE